jgi:hypothetical protein
MHTFICLLTDTRYSVPTLVLIEALTAEDARVLAWGELGAGDYRTGFELWDDERLIDSVQECAASASSHWAAAGLGSQVEVSLVEVSDCRQPRP